MRLKMLLSRLAYMRDMGFRYVCFRCWYEFQRRSGLLKWRFPVLSDLRSFTSLAQWRMQETRFFFDKGIYVDGLNTDDRAILKARVECMRWHKFLFFSSDFLWMKDWHTNPENGFRYNEKQHWTEISDFSSVAGDIKYVWEKSRFTFLYDLIRYDYHFKEDQSENVLAYMLDWIAQNPVNCGPNWKCSQEISLRVLNWTFALHYYKQAPALSEQRFQVIVNSIYRQIEHVRANIWFSRIAVRNNHALTETLALYLTGMLFPFFPESERWKKSGKIWFAEETAFQIADDGTFLQHSMNYHRIVIQLLAWAIELADLNGDRWPSIVYEKARKSLHFLTCCQDTKTGWMPNYGHNDGALFFPLTSCHFRDFRPQLLVLANVLGIDLGYGPGQWNEESLWLGRQETNDREDWKKSLADPYMESLVNGGYVILRDKTSLTFLKCGHYTSRPFQADNLHLDIWVDGENILRDAGTYSYHSDEYWTRYFSGTASHNTLMLGDFDQMIKGPRFIWYDWVRRSNVGHGNQNHTFLEGSFEGFRQVGKGIVHHRKVTKMPDKLHWIVEDHIKNAPIHLPVHQIWHPTVDFFEKFSINATDGDGKLLEPNFSRGWFAGSYGKKSPAVRVVFSSLSRSITTIIEAINC